MIARVLRPDEHANLPEGSGLPKFLEYIPGADVHVVVVEDKGRTVACWGVLRITHLEGVWVDPEYRGNAGVVRQLIRKTREVAAVTCGWAWTGSADGNEDVAGLIARLGGKRIPMESWALPMNVVKNTDVHVRPTDGLQGGY